MQSGFSFGGSLAPAVDLSRGSTGGFGVAPLSGSELGLSQLNTTSSAFNFGQKPGLVHSASGAADQLTRASEGPPSKMALSKLKQLYREFAEETSRHIAAFATHYKYAYELDLELHRLRDELKSAKNRVEAISNSQYQALKQLQDIVSNSEEVNETLVEAEKKIKVPKNDKLLFTHVSDKIDIFGEEINDMMKRFPGGVSVADIFCSLAEQKDLCTWINSFIVS
ncbi:Hypothetical protein DHA2_7685 [Giardia duodenalis]|uniref:Nucleoporin NSP1-like C-terminal domain-containing protein n=1 Tax=Giardia intestinalis TaxID=5741 RepID=V6T8Q8_GIAIN|nr:Hypothetical protein DHA2_7685 [Giardia intestinalis]